mmetsp:Transcript_4722/g.10316  ORF Transcript_4722/g.10316 Transcript_4722/m.10316 type:complete len:586 (+) Transcript_4722:936-2693(+)
MVQPHLHHLLHGDVLVGLASDDLADVRALILHRAAVLSPAQHLVHVTPLLQPRRAQHGLNLGPLHGGTRKVLLVHASGEAPLDIVHWGVVQVLLDVVEGVLGHVGDAQVHVLPHRARVLIGLGLLHQHLHQSTLARTVGAQHRHAAAQAHLHTGVSDLRLGCAGVCVRHVVHLEDRAGGGVDALQTPRHGELEGQCGAGQLVVEPGLRVDGDEVGEVAVVVDELLALVVDHVGQHAVEEACVVGDHEDGEVLLRVDVVPQPVHRGRVQMVRGLVQQQHVGLGEHGRHDEQLHLPASGEVGAGGGEHGLGETDVHEGLGGLLACHAGALQVLAGQQLLDHGHAQVVRGVVVLHVDGLEGLRHALDVTRADVGQQGRLSCTVLAHHAVAAALAQFEEGVVQQDLSSEGQTELDVAQVGAAVVRILLLVRHVTQGGQAQLRGQLASRLRGLCTERHLLQPRCGLGHPAAAVLLLQHALLGGGHRGHGGAGAVQQRCEVGHRALGPRGAACQRHLLAPAQGGRLRDDGLSGVDLDVVEHDEVGAQLGHVRHNRGHLRALASAGHQPPQGRAHLLLHGLELHHLELCVLN